MLLKRGLQHATPLTAAAITVTVTAGVVWFFVAATDSLARLLTLRILPFVLAGAIAPGIARLVLYIGVHRIGASRASALVATAPLFSITIAILLLAERPPRLLLVGAACVVAGGVLLSYRPQTETGSWRRRDLALPVLAALGFALRDVISRHGLLTFPEPMLAAAAATLASVVVMWAFFGLQHRGTVRVAPVGAAFLVLSGVCEGLSYLAMWRALAAGDVSLVAPLVHVNPLFTILLAAVFLRDLERVTWRITTASVLSVAGVLLVLLSRAA